MTAAQTTAPGSAKPLRVAALPRDVATAAGCFDPAALPVLAATAAALEAARADEDAVDASALASIVAPDPLMTLKLLSHVGLLRRGRENGEPETVTAALVMLGISPFFRQFRALRTVEDHLAGSPVAHAGFDAALQRCHRAARFAAGFAAQRLDHDLAVIHGAALLHDFAELLLWLHAPAAAQEIDHRERADASLGRAELERVVLGFTLPELQHALMLRWHLPQVLSRITDDTRHDELPQVRNVVLAVRVARHTEHDWHHPALLDDLHEIAALLHLGIEPARRLLHRLDS